MPDDVTEERGESSVRLRMPGCWNANLLRLAMLLQALFAPLRLLYCLVGPDGMHAIDQAVDIGSLGRSPSPTLVSALVAVGIAGLISFYLKRALSASRSGMNDFAAA